MRSSSPLGLGGTGRADALRFREGGRGALRYFPAMAFPLPCCFLTGEVFPPFHRHIDVGRRDLEREDAPPLLLKCRQGPSCRPLPLTVRRRALRHALRHRTGRNGPDSLQRNTRSASA